LDFRLDIHALGHAPPHLSWRALFRAARLCGIGFTMSLFIATLAFENEALLNMAKIRILAASLASAGCARPLLTIQDFKAGKTVQASWAKRRF